MSAIIIKPIVDRVSQPNPDRVREARKRAGLSQTEAANLVSPAKTAAYKTWSSYELPIENKNRRAIPLATWELFLLLTDQHPEFHLSNEYRR